MQEPVDVIYAVTVTRSAQRRLCEAANINPVPEWRGIGMAEPDLRAITRQLTGRDFDDLVRPEEILNRDPLICVVCGRTFTSTEYQKARHAARKAGSLSAFLAGDRPVHVACITMTQQT